MEAVRQGMQQETADELVRVERHHLGPAAWRLGVASDRDRWAPHKGGPGKSHRCLEPSRFKLISVLHLHRIVGNAGEDQCVRPQHLDW